MKKFLIFFLGIITGIILTILAGVIINKSSGQDPNKQFFEQPGQVMSCQSYEIFQALDNGYGLAWENNGSYSHDLTVLIWDQNGSPFYDDQKVKAPSGMVYRQVGIYKYETQMGSKTVPIITLTKK